jgi:DedD protein
MALLDKGLKQRMVGALVLMALAVIFLPMLFSREDETRRVVVDAPPMPQTPVMPEVVVQPVTVPEPQVLPEEPAPEIAVVQEPAANAPAQPSPPPVAAPAQAPVAQTPPSRLDGDGLPVSWSVQLASLSNRASAENLQKTLRSQGYNAYIRSADGMNRVFVGPVIERAEADRLRDLLRRQQKLDGFIVRFQPERN